VRVCVAICAALCVSLCSALCGSLELGTVELNMPIFLDGYCSIVQGLLECFEVWGGYDQ